MPPDTDPSPAERAWLAADAERWERARQIAACHAEVDVEGVYRVLRNLEKTPATRLRDALMHGRLFGIHRG